MLRKNYKKNIRNPYLRDEKFILKNKNFRKHLFETNKELLSLSKKDKLQFFRKIFYKRCLEK